MIQANENHFPANVVSIIETRVSLLDPDLFVVGRPLRSSDPNQSVGVYAAMWTPEEDSYEMRGSPSGRHEPTISEYTVAVQAFIKDTDEERGLHLHTLLSKMLRTALFRDPALGAGLSALSATLNDYSGTERAKRWGIRRQTFLSQEIDATWLYLSTLEFWLETESL